MAYEELILSIVGISLVATIFLFLRVNKLQNELRRSQQDLVDKMTPIQSITSLTMGLTTSASNLQMEAGNIKEHAMKIATLGEKYGEAERMTRTIHSILIGSYSKGRTGEQVLRKMMAELARTGLVESNVPFGTRVVEYAVKFQDGKILAVDSKVVGTAQLEKLHREDIDEDERNSIANELISKIKGKIEEVTSYIDTKRTLPYAIMAIPDSLLEYSPELIGEASKRNVLIAGYSSVPPLIEYFVKIHAYYSVQQDVETLSNSLMEVHRALNKFTPNYFSNRFDKPVSVITKATTEVKESVSQALSQVDVEKLARKGNEKVLDTTASPHDDKDAENESGDAEP